MTAGDGGLWILEGDLACGAASEGFDLAIGEFYGVHFGRALGLDEFHSFWGWFGHNDSIDEVLVRFHSSVLGVLEL